MAKQLKTSQVQITEIVPVSQGPLRAFVSLKIADSIELRKCRLIQQDGQRPFLNPPQETWTDDSGKRRYLALVSWPAEWRQALQTAALEAWEAHPEGIRQMEAPTNTFREEVRSRAGLTSGTGIGGAR